MSLFSKTAKPIGDGVVVYRGREFAGVVRRRPDGFWAFDPNGRKLGVFWTLREASDTLLDTAEALR